MQPIFFSDLLAHLQNFFLNNYDTLLLAIGGGFLPALIWLFYWLREDSIKPEPWHVLLATFIGGGVGVLLAFIFERLSIPALEQIFQVSFNLNNPELSWGFLGSTSPFLTAWAFIEEFLKFLAAIILGYSTRYFDEPMDAMIYLVTAAIGFAAVENSLFLTNVVWQNTDQSFFILTGNLRFLGATITHAVSSSMLGFFIATQFCNDWSNKIIYFLWGILIATLLHTAFNFFIMTAQSGLSIIRVFMALWFVAIIVLYLFERVRKINCQIINY